MRTNVYREKIVAVLKKSHLLGIADIQKQVGADYSTVYRNVEQLVADGVVRKITLDKHNTKYESIGTHDDHGHFVCIDCGDVESIETSITQQLFSDKTIQDLLVRGLCINCKKV